MKKSKLAFKAASKKPMPAKTPAESVLKKANLELAEKYRKLQIAHVRAIMRCEKMDIELRRCRFRHEVLKQKLSETVPGRKTLAELMSDLAKRSK